MKQKIESEVASALVTINAVGFVPQSPVRFKSGILSPIYIDNRCLPYYPVAWQTIIEGFQTLIEQNMIGFDVIAGVAVGGVPHSSALAYTLKCPSVFVRKEAKDHGTQKLVEGGEVIGQRILLVEDLVTTGGSSLAGVSILRSAGGIIRDMLAIVSYGFEAASDAFQNADIHLHTLTNFQMIVQQAHRIGKLTVDGVAVINDWFDDPYDWGKRQGLE